jgi:hypothetical protein
MIAFLNRPNAAGAAPKLRSRRGLLRCRSLVEVVCLALILPIAARAELTTTAAVTGQYEYNSNVFEVPAGFPAPGTTDYHLADSYLSYGGKCEIDYLAGLQQLYFIASGTQYNYQHFTSLDHADYKFAGGWNWKLGSAWDGKADVSRVQSMVPFYLLNLSTLSLQVEQRETLQIGYQFAGDWRLETTGLQRNIDEPIPAAPALSLSESSGALAIKYLANTRFTLGLSASFLSGDFSGTNGTANPSYHQLTEGVAATYQSGGHSIFTGQVGYANRTSATETDSVSGVTGALDFKDQVTAKTSFDLSLTRVIDNYIANYGSEIDTTAGFNLNWQATYKLGAAVSYSWMYRDLTGQGDNPVGSDRLDHQQFVSLKIDYAATTWLDIKPYVNVQTESSNYVGYIVGANFNATVYGVYATVQWKH